jgi:hypothetical protein
MTQNSNFDASKYQISVEAKPMTIKIPETGEEFEITVKQLSWTKRNHLLSKCFAWDGKTKENKFDGNFYIKECIKEMIVDAPWGPTTEAFLASIDERLGSALETIVPNAFGEEGDGAGGEDPNEIKKE